MTAKTKHGHKAHPRAHGSDEGSAHERLNRMHAMPNRPEGAPMSSAGSALQGAPPPQPAEPSMSMAPPGAAPAAAGGSDDESGEQS